MLAAGTLDRRVRFERKLVTRDPDFKTEVVTWPEVATVWCKVTEESETQPHGGERVTHDMRVYTRRTELVVRYRSDLNSDMRAVLIDRTRTLQIVSLAETGRREGLVIACEDFSV